MAFCVRDLFPSGECAADGGGKPKCSRSLLLAHLERFDALVLEENEELRRLLANGAVEA